MPAELAYRRACICAHQGIPGHAPCPQNQPAKWWERAKDAIANAIKEALAVKRALNLKTPLDDQIGTCEVCGCNLPLAVWVPIQHVKAKTPPAEMAKFEPFCWKRLESSP